jgi:hypothetical protein
MSSRWIPTVDDHRSILRSMSPCPDVRMNKYSGGGANDRFTLSYVGCTFYVWCIARVRKFMLGRFCVIERHLKTGTWHRVALSVDSWDRESESQPWGVGSQSRTLWGQNRRKSNIFLLVPSSGRSTHRRHLNEARAPQAVPLVAHIKNY